MGAIDHFLSLDVAMRAAHGGVVGHLVAVPCVMQLNFVYVAHVALACKAMVTKGGCAARVLALDLLPPPEVITSCAEIEINLDPPNHS